MSRINRPRVNYWFNGFQLIFWEIFYESKKKKQAKLIFLESAGDELTNKPIAYYPKTKHGS